MRPLRIAMLTHSTNPRGGVVHSMSLAEALTDLGHEVVLHAPDVGARGFFRTPRCASLCIPVAPPDPDITAMVDQRIAEYVEHFTPVASRNFDLYHAHDGISGNALATLRQRGLIPSFVRTIHHIDQFPSRRLMELQDRSIATADRHLTVSELWTEALKRERGISATNVGNGIECRRFEHVPERKVAALRQKLSLTDGPIVLSVGGIEERKNTAGIVEAFGQVRRLHPAAQLVIAGGASLLDHRGHQGQVRQLLDGMGLDAAAVHITGTVDDTDMPALYRLADVLAFPSIKEGFGLVVLEAMASGLPVVVSSIAPFTEYLGPDDVVWCDPTRAASIAEAIAVALMPPVRSVLAGRGRAVAGRHGWDRVAAAHLPTYESLTESQYA